MERVWGAGMKGTQERQGRRFWQVLVVCTLLHYMEGTKLGIAMQCTVEEATQDVEEPLRSLPAPHLVQADAAGRAHHPVVAAHGNDATAGGACAAHRRDRRQARRMQAGEESVGRRPHLRAGARARARACAVRVCVWATGVGAPVHLLLSKRHIMLLPKRHIMLLPKSHIMLLPKSHIVLLPKRHIMLPY
eukprot:363674-Chlamydomonas_euryale.AAC.3